MHKFGVIITKEDAEDFGLPSQEFEALITIEPDEGSDDPLVQQRGKLTVTVPGNQEQTKSLAHWPAEQMAHKVTFLQGELKINYGLVMGELLPDTPEEDAQLGDKRFFATARLVKMRPAPVFDGSEFYTLSSSPLIQQFNAAVNAKNPIDQFLGLFKILEDLYGPHSKKVTLAESLKASMDLLQIAQRNFHKTESGVERPLTVDDFNQLMENLVKTRHECAHLRSSKNFGITHGHPRTSSEVEPLNSLLRDLAFEAIKLSDK
jgi:hypothetical protein